jgi:leucyl/phenylalanyl-tRNA--protein transferase
MIPWLEVDTPFPPANSALTKEQGAAGLLAAGADLSAERLLDAYRHGIFPWFSEGQPILWWSTDPRMVLYTDQFKLSKSLKKTLTRLQNNPNVEFKFDSAFEAVMRACAAPRKNGEGTWISGQMICAYTELHRQGYAHSSEVWMNGELVGGAYGLCIGRMFYGESMFSRETDASKMALAQLVFFLRSQKVKMIDCQQETGHLASLGATPISRDDFISWINQAVLQPPITEWKKSEDLNHDK